MPTPSNKKILCVDDSGDDCELYRFILSEAGYEIEIAQSVSSALVFLENSIFNLCLSDLSLPDGTGFELLNTIRAVDASLLFIVLSADARLSTQERAIQAGAQAFFPKPIDYDLLVASIDQLLSIEAAVY
ncbi:response regulator [Microcoleus sp. FACHB-1515]|uniref:response regulator n=1 Tax=Cyanophyceae TaxID=3028117 RepID=UPI00168819EF|nr:response regulator [Microcoleus sp. FACHB-1515]MBD2089997.1 response regulator [Microcoleus sp. FACHB-1515]